MKIPFHCSTWLFLPFALFLGQLLSACAPRSEASAIEAVLNDCAKYSAQVNQSNLGAGDKAAYLADKMQAMDTRDCPQDFQQAFWAHILAWRDAAPALANNSPVNQYFAGTVSEVTGDPTLVGQTQLKASVASQRINDTYKALVAIATQHGARVPVSVVKA